MIHLRSLRLERMLPMPLRCADRARLLKWPTWLLISPATNPVLSPALILISTAGCFFLRIFFWLPAVLLLLSFLGLPIAIGTLVRSVILFSFYKAFRRSIFSI